MNAVDVMPSKMRLWRTAHGFSLSDVSGLSGFSEPTLSLVESGKRKLSARGKVHLAKSVGAKVRDLFEPDPLPSEERNSQLAVR